MTPDRQYIRIAGRGLKRDGASFLIRTRAKLWAGKAHLLAVYNCGVAEDYKRFYYKDIQSITFAKTNRGRNWNIALFIIFIILLLVSFKGAFLLFLPAAALVFLIINWIAGPTCVTVLETAVSREELPSLGRLKNAVRAMDFLHPMIEKAQKGILTNAQNEISGQSPPLNVAAGGAFPVHKGKRVYSDYDGAAHLALFSLMTLSGLYYGAEILFSLPGGKYIGALLSLAVTLLLILSIIRQRGSRLERDLRMPTRLSLGYVFLSYPALSIYYFMSQAYPGAANIDQQIAAISFSSFIQHVQMVFMGVMALYGSAAGIYGLFETKGVRNRAKWNH